MYGIHLEIKYIYFAYTISIKPDLYYETSDMLGEIHDAIFAKLVSWCREINSIAAIWHRQHLSFIL